MSLVVVTAISACSGVTFSRCRFVTSCGLPIWLSGRYILTWYLSVVYFFIFFTIGQGFWVVDLLSSSTLISRFLHLSLTFFIHILYLIFSTLKAFINLRHLHFSFLVVRSNWGLVFWRLSEDKFGVVFKI